MTVRLPSSAGARVHAGSANTFVVAYLVLRAGAVIRFS